MANYPLSFDNFTNPTAVDSLNTPSHSLQHADANDAIEALETKLGLSASPAGSATAGHVLVAGTGGTTTWTTVSAGAISTTGGTAGQYLSAGTAGVATWADVPAAGLTLVKTQTIGTAVSSVEVTGAFSATYDNYKVIVIGGVGSVEQTINMKLGASTTGYFYALRGNFFTGADATENASNTSSFAVAGAMTTDYINVNCEIFSPFLAKYTTAQFQNIRVSYATIGGGVHKVATSYTDFTLTPASGTMTGGTIYVYGYKK